MINKFAARIREIVAELSYKPGWQFYVPAIDKEVLLRITSDMVPDSLGRDLKNWQVRGCGIPEAFAQLNDDELRDAVIGLAWEMIASIELHEAQEWFKQNGQTIDNPHHYPDGCQVTAAVEYLLDLWQGYPRATEHQSPHFPGHTSVSGKRLSMTKVGTHSPDRSG